jgi:hypothetical protein
MAEKKIVELVMVEVWGIAAGRRTTKEATSGAFTTREYRGTEEWEKAKEDWLQIVCIKERRPT